MKKSCPETPIIIVANKIDLRNDRLSLLRLDRLQNLKPIETAEGKNLARNLSVGYVECSSSMGVSFHTILNIFILQLFIYIFINSLQFFQEWIEKYFRWSYQDLFESSSKKWLFTMQHSVNVNKENFEKVQQQLMIELSSFVKKIKLQILLKSQFHLIENHRFQIYENFISISVKREFYSIEKRRKSRLLWWFAKYFYVECNRYRRNDRVNENELNVKWKIKI